MLEPWKLLTCKKRHLLTPCNILGSVYRILWTFVPRGRRGPQYDSTTKSLGFCNFGRLNQLYIIITSSFVPFCIFTVFFINPNSQIGDLCKMKTNSAISSETSWKCEKVPKFRIWVFEYWVSRFKISDWNRISLY